MDTNPPRAQSCLCCRHPLTDEPSRIIGLGPDCRKKYLVKDGPADLGKAWGWIASSDLPPAILDSIWSAGDDPESILRPLIVHASTHINDNSPRRLAARVAWCLGYRALWDRIEEYAKAPVLEGTDGKTLVDGEPVIRVSTPYDTTFNQTIRSVPGVRKETEGDRFKCWVVPFAALHYIIRILALIWPGEDIALPDVQQTSIAKGLSGDTLSKVLNEARTVLGFDLVRKDNLLQVTTPYNKAFVAELKAAIPWRDRQWNKVLRVWAVKLKYETLVIALIDKHYGAQVTARG